MPELICNTSPLQYLHQLDRLLLLPRLAGSVIVPDAVAAELAAGRAQGVELPDPTRLDWCRISRPGSAAVLPLVTDLGAGETAVLAMALERDDADACKLDDVRELLRKGQVHAASEKARVYELTPVASSR